MSLAVTMFKRARAEIFDRNREVGISNVTTAASLVTFPVLAGILGGVVPSVRTPSAAMVSGVQHFAAGIVMAAVAGKCYQTCAAEVRSG
ncbi:conserved membrane protein [Mycobacterium tuberculosis T17]|nr:conserved membrane protein [Mycobacterium tuberculosis T17]